MGLKAGGREGSKKVKKEKAEEEEEKIPHKCESIGHRPLRGAAREGHSALSV